MPSEASQLAESRQMHVLSFGECVRVSSGNDCRGTRFVIGEQGIEMSGACESGSLSPRVHA